MVEGPQARATGEVQAKFDPNTPFESLLPVGAGYIGVLGELQKGDALQWPVPLQGPEYEKVCKKLSKLFAEAIQEIRADTLNEIQENLKDLEESINKNIIAFSVSQYVQARRYLIRLNRGLQTLQQTNPRLSAPGLPQKLADVPEVALEDPSYAFLPGDEAIDHAGHLIDKINFVNSKKRDGFVEALARKRADLGLPFITGDASRLPAERGRHFFHELTELHLAMRFVFASNDPAALATSLPNPAARQCPGALTDGVVAAMATSSPYPAAQPAVAIQARVAALVQVVTPEGAELGQQMVKYLTTISHVDATRALARLAVFSEDDEVHKDAVAALAARQGNDFTDILLSSLKYPWPAVAERAADAIAKLKRKDLLPQLVEVLERPDPRAPQTQQKDGKNVIVMRELVRISHLRNCLLCHPPASPAAIPPETGTRELRAVFQCGDRNTSARNADAVDLTAPVPLPGRALPTRSPRGSYRGITRGNPLLAFDVTYLRQDFSVKLPVAKVSPWPDVQRFDFLVRTSEVSEKEAQVLRELLRPVDGDLSPYQRAAVASLRQLTGQDAEPNAAAWRRVLERDKNEKK